MILVHALPGRALREAARGFILLRRVFRIGIVAAEVAPGLQFQFLHFLTSKQSMRPVSIIR